MPFGIRAEDEVEYACTALRSPSLRRGEPRIGSTKPNRQNAGQRRWAGTRPRSPAQDSYTKVVGVSAAKPPRRADELGLNTDACKAELFEVGAGVGLIERKQRPDNIVANEVANGKLDAAKLFAQASTGSASFAGRGNRERSKLGKRVLKLAQGAQALGAGNLVVGVSFAIKLEKVAELANVANPLLPIPLDFAAATFVPNEVDSLLGFEVAIVINIILLGAVGVGDHSTDGTIAPIGTTWTIRIKTISTIGPTVPAVIGSKPRVLLQTESLIALTATAEASEVRWPCEMPERVLLVSLS